MQQVEEAQEAVVEGIVRRENLAGLGDLMLLVVEVLVALGVGVVLEIQEL